MTKDFMTLVDQGILTKEKALEAYLTSRSVFFPPHPSYVVESTIKGFKLYWNKKIDLDKLCQYCYVRDQNALFKYYGQFIEDEE